MKIFFENFNDDINAIKCTTVPIMAAEIKSSNIYQLTKKVISEGIVIMTAIIVPLTNIPCVGSFVGIFLSVN